MTAVAVLLGAFVVFMVKTRWVRGSGALVCVLLVWSLPRPLPAPPWVRFWETWGTGHGRRCGRCEAVMRTTDIHPGAVAGGMRGTRSAGLVALHPRPSLGLVLLRNLIRLLGMSLVGMVRHPVTTTTVSLLATAWLKRPRFDAASF